VTPGLNMSPWGMRLKLGRPDLAAYHRQFDVPAASPDDLSVTFLGVSTLLIDDHESPVMIDGFFSRPSLFSVAARKLNPNRDRVAACLDRAGVTSLAAVLPVHSHFDHVMDSALVADMTSAQLVGGESTANVGRGHGLPTEQVSVVAPRTPRAYGNWTITHTVSAHCPPDRYPGTIDTPLVPPAKANAYKCGEAWSIHLTHTSGSSLLVQGSAGFVPGALAGTHADVVYLGIGQLGIHDESFIQDYWREIVTTVGARRVVLTHWDDFFRPLDEPLRSLPSAGDDLDHTMRVLTALAAADSVHLSFPTVWIPENPWA
jgi:L-ascorbate metabolism protein UlaG (beta-lactamase superfamily)